MNKQKQEQKKAIEFLKSQPKKSGVFKINKVHYNEFTPYIELTLYTSEEQANKLGVKKYGASPKVATDFFAKATNLKTSLDGNLLFPDNDRKYKSTQLDIDKVFQLVKELNEKLGFEWIGAIQIVK